MVGAVFGDRNRSAERTPGRAGRPISGKSDFPNVISSFPASGRGGEKGQYGRVPCFGNGLLALTGPPRAPEHAKHIRAAGNNGGRLEGYVHLSSAPASFFGEQPH
ncbi:hypothetical protein, partial [Streptomyces griseorubiginosus]|uniref:hypothetical protein n=1 Tax=Streptomyces griseorubiginosus TaxID=67304 RepID=UPI001AD73BA7